MQKFQVYLVKFRSIIVILLGTLILFAMIVSRIIPVLTDIFKSVDGYSKAEVSLKDKEKTLSSLKEKTAKAEAQSDEVPKEFFKPIEVGMDTESVIADEFAEILTIIRENQIKTRSIKYEYDPQDDNFVKNVPDKYNVARLNLEMISNYKDFESFLKELYNLF